MIPLAVLMPMLVSAQGDFGEVEDLFERITYFIGDTLVPFVFALALLVFLWGIYVHFIQGGSNEQKREEGKKLMLWAIIGFVVMLSIWAIVEMLSLSIFGTDDTLDNLPNVPTL